MRSITALSVLVVLAGCAAEPPTPVTLPGQADATVSRDPIVEVGQDIAAFYRRPQPNQPAAAARAIAEIEWLAVSLPMSPRWRTAPGGGMAQLTLARDEARAGLGIPRNASPQAVINGLSAAAAAIVAGDDAALARALPRATFPLGPQETVRRLAGPPPNRNIMPALFALRGGLRGGGG
jgi:hypothetical protein